jgi:cobalt-zinc-cadmium efflux system outer membrane protein
MTGRSLLAASIVVAVAAASVRGQEPPASPSASAYLDPAAGVGLDDAIGRALANEPGVHAARLAVDVTRGEREQSALRANPSSTFELRGEPGGTDNLLSVGVQWPLELFRRQGRILTAEQQVSAAQLTVADRERLLVADVRTQYGRAVAAIREADVAAQLAATVDRQFELRRARADEGGAPRLEADLLDVERRRLQAERDLALGRAERAVLALKPLLGMEAAQPLRLRESLDALVTAYPLSAVPHGQAVLSQRSDVRAAAQRVAVADARVDQAGREGRFDVSLFGGYMRMDSGFPQLGLSLTGTPERVRGQFHYVSGGATVMLPLLNRNQGAAAAARAERASAEEQRRAVELAAGAEVAGATARARRAQQALEAYGQATRDLARRNLDVVRQTFELGRMTVFDVMAEQRRYLDFERAYTMTLLEAWEARADLARALGEMK